MRKKRVTITDIAAKLKLSTCTVSKILNRSFNGFTYAEATIKRVESAANRMGYIPNAQARSLRTRKTLLIGFLLPSAQVSVFGCLTDILEIELRKRGYEVLIAHSQNNPEIEQELLRVFHSRGIDGLIWIPTQMRITACEGGSSLPFPTVVLDRPHCTKSLPFVATANFEACRELAERIRDCGHRYVGVIQASADDRSIIERQKGLEAIPGMRLTVADGANEAATGKAAIIAMMRKKNPPSAVVALSEPLAIGALAGLRELDLQVGKDLSFAAFDDFPLAAHWSPRITLINQDLAGLATASIDVLFELIKNPSSKVRDVRVPATLEWRESVVPIS